MKKLFTLFAGVACVMAANAQDFTFTVNDAVVADESTVSVGFDDSKGYWTSYPHIYISSTEDATVTLQVHIPSLGNEFDQIMFCPGGYCREPNALGIATAELKLEKGVPSPLELHCELQSSIGKDVCPEINAPVEITLISRNKPIFSFTVVFDSSASAGIDNVTASGDFVNLVAGNILEYNVPDSTKLDIYSLNGATVMERVVNGHGSLSLDRLAPGVYLYKAGELSGKVLVK